MSSLAPYMQWAKQHVRPRVNLAGSNLLSCGLADLPGAREAFELHGDNDNGYRPLIESIATTYGVTPEMVATAQSTSGANFLVFAALVKVRDDVLNASCPTPARWSFRASAESMMRARSSTRWRGTSRRVWCQAVSSRRRRTSASASAADPTRWPKASPSWPRPSMGSGLDSRHNARPDPERGGVAYFAENA